MSRSELRVAVAGASGIGRHHANWHARVGSEVVAFLGSRPDRCAETARQLRALFGFAGRSYTDLAELLERERPDIVDVCTPNELHYDGVRAALAAGCHVLCEKPLVWDGRHDGARLRRQAADLVRRAAQAGRHLGLCTQYAAAIDHYRRLQPGWDPGAAESFEAELETLSRGRQRDAAAVWVDMGSHPLSLLLAVFPGAEIVVDSLRVRYAGSVAEAEFTARAGARECACHITVRDREEGPPTRRFGFDGRRVRCHGRPGDDGFYRSVLVPDGEGDAAEEDVGDDYMHLLIRQFTDVVAGHAGAPVVPPEVAVRNLELQLQIHEAA